MSGSIMLMLLLLFMLPKHLQTKNNASCTIDATTKELSKSLLAAASGNASINFTTNCKIGKINKQQFIQISNLLNFEAPSLSSWNSTSALIKSIRIFHLIQIFNSSSKTNTNYLKRISMKVHTCICLSEEEANLMTQNARIENAIELLIECNNFKQKPIQNVSDLLSECRAEVNEFKRNVRQQCGILDATRYHCLLTKMFDNATAIPSSATEFVVRVRGKFDLLPRSLFEHAAQLKKLIIIGSSRIYGKLGFWKFDDAVFSGAEKLQVLKIKAAFLDLTPNSTLLIGLKKLKILEILFAFTPLFLPKTIFHEACDNVEQLSFVSGFSRETPELLKTCRRLRILKMSLLSENDNIRGSFNLPSNSVANLPNLTELVINFYGYYGSRLVLMMPNSLVNLPKLKMLTLGEMSSGILVHSNAFQNISNQLRTVTLYGLVSSSILGAPWSDILPASTNNLSLQMYTISSANLKEIFHGYQNLGCTSATIKLKTYKRAVKVQCIQAKEIENLATIVMPQLQHLILQSEMKMSQIHLLAPLLIKTKLRTVNLVVGCSISNCGRRSNSEYFAGNRILRIHITCDCESKPCVDSTESQTKITRPPPPNNLITSTSGLPPTEEQPAANHSFATVLVIIMAYACVPTIILIFCGVKICKAFIKK